jgi:hypothetical protein
MSEYSLYLSNFTRSGRAFFLYLVNLSPNLEIDPGGGGRIQKELRSITIVRDPRDVIPSSVINSLLNDSRFSNNFNKEIIKAQRLYVDFYRELSTQDDLVVIDFNDLVNEPEKTIEAIHKLLQIPFVMKERDPNMVFNEGIHIHTSKVYSEYDEVKKLSDEKDYSAALETMNKMLQRKLQVL